MGLTLYIVKSCILNHTVIRKSQTEPDFIRQRYFYSQLVFIVFLYEPLLQLFSILKETHKSYITMIEDQECRREKYAKASELE